MKTAIIAYDLKHIKPDDNARVKRALESYANAHAVLSGLDVFSPFPRWVDLKLPDTTLIVTIANPNVTAAQLASEVAGVIKSQNATVGKIFVAFLSTSDDFLVNE
ncbi:hypothetical protein [Tuwongella immobilis]|uniref:Uncharacterized protein n=1 Tax=Tuwongella immobilis TaxID=692036 RepID=A0A6C2YV30_9BACT|nr:hypothetical protein [Tuwongella immobilis]VIP04732.1 unnamed protein product [Tuwongella immobilis]VTS06823.1 unnamed protein product [Tuwongella immobilis]